VTDDCTSCGISRRTVLKGAGAVTTVALAVPTLGTGVAFASTNATRRGDVVVNVFLRGGMDGLSVVVPRHEAAGTAHYLAARPTLAVDPAASIPLNADFGLHPAMGAIMPVWNRGDLALLPTAGFPLNNRSHFTVQRQMDFGLGTTAGGVTGWVARHLDLAPEILPVGVRAADMPRGQRSMAGSTVSITMGSVSSFRVNGFTGPGGVAQTALRELHSGGSNIVTDRAVQALDALDLVAAAPISPPANGAVYPATGRGRQFGEHMRQIAQLIRADVGLEAAATQANLSWDTHANQGGYLAGTNRDSLEALAQVLAAFAQDLGPDLDRVTVVLMTEFGRTFRENGNGGTDHGRASTMLVMGGGIRGGLYGDWPGLAPADIDGNGLRVTVDYRYVLADILEHRLGNAALGQVLPGFVVDETRRLNLADPLTPAELGPDDSDDVTDQEPESEPLVVSTAPAVASYRWDAPGGGVVTFDVPAPVDDDGVAQLESLRHALGAPDAAYVSAMLDNRSGTDPLAPPVVILVGPDGSTSYREAWVLVEMWRTGATDETADQEVAATVAVLQQASPVAPGAVGRVILAASGSIPPVTEVRVDAGTGEVVLTPAGIDLVELDSASP
jgi:uncharacterized protein (DUF1501 family)